MSLLRLEMPVGCSTILVHALAVAVAVMAVEPASSEEAATPIAGTKDQVRLASSAAVESPKARASSRLPSHAPDWAAEAIFYQLFPGRFRNGDPTNDPTRSSLEFPANVSEKWRVSPWTGDWYARADWEKERGGSFYDDGVFDRRYGGDLRGVIQELDYLHDLGVNALYLNPVFYARSLHKYDGNTYHHVDPHFGPDPKGDLELIEEETSDPATWKWTAADRVFLELVRKAHERGIRVVLDGVFNHTGRDFFAFADLVKNQSASPYADWYIVQSFDNPSTPNSNEFRYKGWWGVMTLPEFADNEAGDDLHPGPKKYIFDATRRWMDPNGDGNPGDGIDGWRLDVAAEVPVGFWRDWNQHCRDINPECYTVAEHWDDAAQFLADGGFSATMNYHGFAIPVKGFLIDSTLSARDFASTVTERMREHPRKTALAVQNLVDSHDTDRLASMIVNSAFDRPYVRPERFDYDINERVSPRYWDGYSVRKPTARERRIQRLVVLMQATFVGAPMVYYGDEAGMWGADDPCDRMPMVWPDLKFDDQTGDPLGRSRRRDKVGFDGDLHAYYQAALNLRASNRVLSRGEIDFVFTDDEMRCLAYRRFSEEDSLYVVLNRGEEVHEVSLPLQPGETVTEVFTASGEPHRIRLTPLDAKVRVRLPGLEGVVLKRQRTASVGLAAE